MFVELFVVSLSIPFFGSSNLFYVHTSKVNRMQFSGGNRRKKLRLTGDQKNVSYPHSLQFYLQPPSENISLIEFENLAIDRVKCK